jgi:hypothetical protein
MDPDVITAIVATASFSAIGIAAWASVLFIRRRLGPTSGPGPNELRQVNDQLARLQTAVDAMSVEVERISEGQRFTTKLLAEKAKSDA